MLELTRRLATPQPAAATLTLDYEQRTRGRLRVQLDDGRAAGLFLERGLTLRGGDCLTAADGTVVQVRAAAELVSRVVTTDPLLHARLCYHLGNRHVPLQISPGEVRYRHDHVLDDMVRHLGAVAESAQLPFEPEDGAYSAHRHGDGVPAHTHDHPHSHDHGH